ncbi:ceramide synthase 4 isoform X2 [Mirounga angustirostris]|uniref:ceramide synthase 4 isoform X2 n=1 Tax=Mirounga angustirostris TaxID=9716 RepID=UPI00313A9D31
MELLEIGEEVVPWDFGKSNQNDVVQPQRMVLAGEAVAATQQLVGCPGRPGWPGLRPPPGYAGSPAPGAGPGGHALRLREICWHAPEPVARCAPSCQEAGEAQCHSGEVLRHRRVEAQGAPDGPPGGPVWPHTAADPALVPEAPEPGPALPDQEVLRGQESWLWTPAMCWDSYPNQPLKPALYYWYLLELSFYVSLLITLPFDVKRKDFKEQVAHHFVTIILIVFSYSANLLRIGSLVLLLHDASDYLLEAGKMFNYTNRRKVCDALFIIFSLVFFYTRLVLFPTQILYTTYYESIAEWSPFFGYYFFNVLLMVLQLLHVFWSCLILRMLYSFLKKGRMEKDVRSDVEESDSSEGEAVQEHLPLKNGAAHRAGAAPTDGPRSRLAGRLANGHTPAT